MLFDDNDDDGLTAENGDDENPDPGAESYTDPRIGEGESDAEDAIL